MKFVKFLLCFFSLLAFRVDAQQVSSQLSLSSIEKQLSVLQKEKEEASAIQRTQDLPARANEQRSLRAKFAKASPQDQEFLNKKISLVAQDYQILTEIERVWQQYKTILDEHIKILQEYKNDPEFSKLKVPAKAAYGFEEFEELGRRLFSIRTRLADLEKSRAAAYDDLSKRKKSRAMLEEEYQEKVRQQEDFARAESTEGQTHVQNAELIDLQKRLLNDKRILAEVKTKEAEQRISYLDSQTTIARAQRARVNEDYEAIKRALYVDASYVKKAESELERKRHESAAIREQLHDDIKSSSFAKEEMHKKVTEAAERLGINPAGLPNIGDWDKTPSNVQEWNVLCLLGYLALQESVIDLGREYKEALVELEKAKLRGDEVTVAIIRSWHALTKSRLGFSAHALQQEIKFYEAPKAEIQGDLAVLNERRARALTLMQELNSLLERIKKLSASLKMNEIDFKENASQFEVCTHRMHEAEDQVRTRMYLTAKLIETYSTTIALLEGTNKRIETVVNELGTKSFWGRSALSITWTELKNFFPDIKRFTYDVIAGMTLTAKNFSMSNVYSWLFKNRSAPSILLFFLRILLALLLYLALRMYIPVARDYFSLPGEGHLLKTSIRLWASFILNFINRHSLSLFLWLLGFILVYYELAGNAYWSISFYLASIPFMLYIVYAFFADFKATNRRFHYGLLSETYESRFIVVVSLLSYITVVLFFFRAAFIAANYHASAVPAILLALNFIVFQLALMSLISKEWILQLIPRNTPLWEWIYDNVSHYYYILWLFMIAIIIMSNPYVGYGRQVLYVLARLVIIGSFIPLFSYLYTRIRRVSSNLFFYYGSGENLVERFKSARTWYGFFVVLMFCAFVILGLIVGARVIGYHVDFRDILSWLKYELYSPGFDDVGRRIAVTPLAFLKVIVFFLAGLVAAYVINNLILRRIFDPLLVSSGIQNTVFTFSRYAITFIALLIGFKTVGLQSFAMQLLLPLGALALALKDPVLDLFSYFIILVQRPIKIGDLIALDDNVTGVVRHITPRSVVLRRKNSVTIMVPNSHIVTRPLVNWNYSPNFFAMNDMLITIPYTCDPDKVRLLIVKIVDNNINILKTPAPLILLHDFVDNGFQFMIRAYLTGEKVLEQWEIASNLRLDIIRTLRVNGIQVAMPTRILRVLPEESCTLPKNEKREE